MITVLSVFGTRPEAIKMAPVVRELEKQSGRIKSVVCVTAQHRQMLDQVLDIFSITPDYDLNLMQQNQTLAGLTAKTISCFDRTLDEVKPDWVLVQGDTTTVMAVSLVCFYKGVKVGHIEAGLRTNNKKSPFPEEINRRITGVLADLHFAPTERAKEALLKEGVSPHEIVVTGNTVIDSLLWVREIVNQDAPAIAMDMSPRLRDRRIILVTGHRRESFGEGFSEICFALKDLVDRCPDVCVVYPVHMNPNVRDPVNKILGDAERVFLLEPLSYKDFVWLMDRASIILTDSGGVQEEAPSLGKPVLVMRNTTERPEGLEAGNACLVGTDRASIAEHAMDLLGNRERYDRMSRVSNPYGDGLAAERIVRFLLEQNDAR